MDVLIADDDVVSRRLLEVTLSHAGYQVTVAANGAEALRVLEESEGPRLAVLDWMMPELDGVDVCRAVARHFFLRHLHNAHGNREFMHLLISPHVEHSAHAF